MSLPGFEPGTSGYPMPLVFLKKCSNDGHYKTSALNQPKLQAHIFELNLTTNMNC